MPHRTTSHHSMQYHTANSPTHYHTPYSWVVGLHAYVPQRVRTRVACESRVLRVVRFLGANLPKLGPDTRSNDRFTMAPSAYGAILKS